MRFRSSKMHSKKYFALFLVICMMSSDVMIPVVLAGGKGGHGGHGLELLLAAGILAKLLRKKGHHHGHHHHHGRHSSGGGHHHHPHEAGAQTVEVVHVAPPLGGYSSHYPTSAQSAYGSYGGAQAATTSFSSSIEYPFSAAASQPMPIQHLPYGGPASAASYLGYEPQPVQMYPPLPLSITDSGAPDHM